MYSNWYMSCVYVDWLLAEAGRNLLYGYITMHSQQNIKFGEYCTYYLHVLLHCEINMYFVFQ
jgi:hypothetical protein